MPHILSLTSDATIAESFLVMHSLRPHLQGDTYVAQIRELTVHRYELVGLYDADKLLAVAGFVVNTNLVSGKKLYVEDLVTAARYPCPSLSRIGHNSAASSGLWPPLTALPGKSLC